MDLVRDLLDKQLIDRNRRPMGRVDGIVMEMLDNRPPRLTYIETGPVTAFRRISKRMAEWIGRLNQRAGRRCGAFRIPCSKIRSTGTDVRVDVDVRETPVLAWEQWVRERIIGRIPGG